VIDRNARRLSGVDLLRTLAILFVLMNHVNVRLSIAKVPFKQGLPKSLVHTLFNNGQNGVRIFFAISGFLITSMSLRRWGKLSSMDLRRFYRLRFARIAPLLLALLAVLSLLHAAQVSDYVITAKRGGFLPALFAALTFHVNLQEATHGYLPGNWDILWSLSVEEVFYIGFPVACLLLRRKALLALLLTTFVIIGPFARTVLAHGNELWSDYSYLSGMDAIALGCLTAMFLEGRQFSLLAQRICGAAGLAFMTLILGFNTQAIGSTGLDMTILALGTCLLIIPAAQSNWNGAHLLLVPGRNSYEIYMTHMFVVFAGLHLFLAAGKPMGGVPVYFVGVILIATFLGHLIALHFSEPLNQRLRGGSGKTS
jgi:peptidoglycan/LPS O-acetylase OafA/YrhL